MNTITYLVLLGLIITCLPSGLGAVKVRIRAYSGTGEVGIKHTKVAFTQGTRLLLICEVTGLPEDSEVVSYRWFHSLTGETQGRYQIQDRDPYYRVVKDTLLVDVTSLDQGGKYTCFVRFTNLPDSSAIITAEGNAAPFLYTRTSLLPEHSVLTDVQQATGRNGQQWITCRSGGEGTRPEIWMGSELVVNSSTANSVTIGLGSQHPNGLYHCLTAQSQREYFSLFLRNSVTLPTPTVSGQDTSMWTLTSPDGSQVERYIVEFECRVRNITFVEKYMSVSASGGTGRVATSVSCFGGLGQLYRVKVWAVSGPNISRAPVCVTGIVLSTEASGATSATPATAVNTVTPATPATAVNTVTPATPTTAVNTVTPTTHTTAVNTVTLTTPTTAVIIATPTGPQPSSTGEHPTISTFIGVGIGVGIFLLLVFSIVVVVIVVVVVVRRKASCKQKRDVIVNDNPYYNNTVVVLQELEMLEQGVGADHNDASNNNQSENEDEDEDFDVGYNPYEVVDRKLHSENTMTPTLNVSSTPASVTMVDAVHAVVDKNKKKGAKKETEDEPTVINKEDLYAMPMRKAVKITDKGGGVVVSGGVEEGGHYDDEVELTYKAKTDSIPR